MNIEKMMQEAQKLQNTLKKKLSEFENKEFEYEFKYVKVKIKGSLEILNLNILDKEIIDPEDIPMLSDIITSAINESIQKTIAEKEAIANSVAPGMGNLF